MKTYDLIVIGAGMAGVAAANKCGAAGWSVVIVDSLPYGGTCALRGCDPKKILRRGAEVIDAANLMRGKGIDPGSLTLNWSDLMRHKRSFTDPVPANMEKGLHKNGVETLHGNARFVGPNQIEIDGAPYDARFFLIATGARPRRLNFSGAKYLIDSTEFLDLEQLPKRVLFVGGSFISFEFAHIAARAGSTPIILDHGQRPLRGFDGDMVELLIRRSAAIGVKFLRQTSVLSVENAGGSFVVTVQSDGATSTIEADLVVHGAGRHPDLSRLNLEAANIDHGPEGVSVKGHLQSTSNPAVFAAGDAADTAGLPLTPVAVVEGKVVASNMLKGKEISPDYTAVPMAVFTVPELVRVGMLEEEAQAANLDFSVRHTDTSHWFSNFRIGETHAAVKVLVDNGTDQILGAHMMGPDYGELINTFGLAMKLGLTTRQLKSATAAYPSVGSDLGSLI